jgi:hypothetical protein
MNTIGQYKKFIAACLTGILGWGTMVVESGDEAITSTEWIALATIIVTAVLVYILGNDPAPAPPAEPPTITPPGAVDA